MRIGHGYDAHRFGDGDHIMLGGVRIAHECGMEAHSDGDVVLHALCDAVLGALGRGDIGAHFPDTDPDLAGVDSRLLLRRVAALMHSDGLRLGNADLTILAQTPKLAPHIQAMRETIAVDLGTGAECVNVKATTTEGMGFVGRCEGIAVHAVVLLTEAGEPA